MKNPFKSLRPIDKERFLDEVFSSAARAVEKETFEIDEKMSRYKRGFSAAAEIAKQKEGLRIKTCGTEAAARLKALSQAVPDVSKLPPLYREIVLVFASEADLERAAYRLSWASKRIEGMKMLFLQKVSRTKHTQDSRNVRKEFFGRVADFTRKCANEFEMISYLWKSLKNLPDLKEEKTFAIAGLPNVGKTSLLKALTGSAPEIQPYPFTTKGLMVGYANFGFEEVQFIDTPGLLDRPSQKRNTIELQSIAVLKTISDFVIYIFDLSETCGYTLERQKNLFEEVKKTFKKPIIAVANKSDIVGGKTLEDLGIDAVKISCENGEGVQNMISLLSGELKNMKNNF
ncbi:MAG TPA: GTPase [archaeon]|nr:GTPase [archaeon]